MQYSTPKKILAIVGMPGAGKSEVVSFLQVKGIPFVRFGEITDEGLKKQGIAVTPGNEKLFRENLRKELGMEAYAVLARPKIEDKLAQNDCIAIDGLYSWEEYRYLKNLFPNLILVHIYAEPEVRYKRLSQRAVRPLTRTEAEKRDIAEIENLHKAGPIAIADYQITNNKGKEELQSQIADLLRRLEIV